MMKMSHETRFFGAVTSICCALLTAGCSTGAGGGAPFGAAGNVGPADDEDLDGTTGEGDDAESPTGGEDTEGGDTGGSDTGDSGTGDGGTGGGENTGGSDTGGGDTGGGDTGGGDTGGEQPPQAEDDFDHQANPAVLAIFRATSPAPLSFDEPVFNIDNIDTKGLQYNGDVSNPGDAEDWIQFSIVPGQNDPTISLSLDCDDPDVIPQPLRAILINEDADVLKTIVCGQGPQSVNLVNASSFDDYWVRVEGLAGSEFYSNYTLEVDGHCNPSGCEFQPFQ